MSHGLAHHLSDNGFRVVFISHFPYFEIPQIIKKNQGEIIVCSWPTKKRPTNFIDFWWFVKLYYKYKPDFVLGHFVGSNISILLSKILSLGKTQTFEYYHTVSGAIITDLKKVDRKQKMLFLRKKMFYNFFCDKVICPSEIAKSDLESFFRYSKEIIIPNPITDRLIDFFVFKNDGVIVSFLGRFEPTKGILEMILAFKNFKIKNPLANIKLQIAGSGSLNVEVLNLIQDQSDIVFFGALQYGDIDRYLLQSHYTIIPSKFDNLPTVGLESLMLGRPILIANNTGLTHFLEHDVTGFIFNFAIDSIENAFNTAFLNFIKIDQLSKNARECFLKNFTMNRYFKTITPLFQ